MRPRWYHDSRTERVLASRYPFGIARRLLNRASDKKQNATLTGPILFVASCADSLEAGVVSPFSGPQGELLAKAISHGLKWSLDTARLIFAFPKAEEHSITLSAEMLAKAHSALQEAIKKLHPRMIVALGPQAAQALGIAQPEKLADRWLKIEDYHVLCSNDLRDVLKDAGVKKAFWQDLKLLAHKFQ